MNVADGVLIGIALGVAVGVVATLIGLRLVCVARPPQIGHMSDQWLRRFYYRHGKEDV
jgi:hypothetical protein